MDYKSFQEQTFTATELESKPLMLKMADNYKQAETEIIAELERIYGKYLSTTDPADYYNIMLQYGRQEALLTQVQALYVKYSKAAGKNINEISTLAMTNTFYRNQYSLSWLAPELNFSMLDKKLVELTVTGTATAWAAIKKKLSAEMATIFQPSYGTLSDLLKRNQDNDLVKINQTITQAFINGQPIKTLSENIAKTFETADYQAMRIAQTEFTRSSNAGDYAATIDAAGQGVNLKRMWICTIDDKTREAHQEADGQIVGVDEPFIVDGEEGMFPCDFPSASNSVNCRCTTVTIVDGEPPELRRGRDPVTGQNEVFSFTNYNDFMISKGMEKSDSGAWIKKQ